MNEDNIETGRQDNTQLYVVSVLNSRELVVSGGASAGLQEGDVLRVLAPAEKLVDPKTNEVLGELVAAKAVVQVYEVSKKYALARTFRTQRVKLSGGFGVSDIFNPPKFETRTETLILADEHKDTNQNAVTAGDPVQIWDGPVDDTPSFNVWK